MLAAIEIHNKPVFAYRYEVATMLTINAWELVLKAYIHKFLKSVKLFKKDGRTKDFGECLSCVASTLGKEFDLAKESLNCLYEYRNQITHFYCEELSPLLYSLLRVNIQIYGEFIQKHFEVDLSLKNNLILLPLSFTKPFSPVDFLSNSSALSGASTEVKNFIQAIIDSTKRLENENISDSILIEYRMSLQNENRVTNADIIAAINNAQPQTSTLSVVNSLNNVRLSDDPNAKEIRFAEDDLFNHIFTQEYDAVVKEARRRFKDFKSGKQFHSIMNELKKNPSVRRVRALDPNNPKSLKKDWYSEKIFDELAKFYEEKVAEE